MWKMVRQEKCLDLDNRKSMFIYTILAICGCQALVLLLGATWMYFSGNKVNEAVFVRRPFGFSTPK